MKRIGGTNERIVSVRPKANLLCLNEVDAIFFTHTRLIIVSVRKGLIFHISKKPVLVLVGPARV